MQRRMSMTYLSDLEIAQQCAIRPITEVPAAENIDVDEDGRITGLF